MEEVEEEVEVAKEVAKEEPDHRLLSTEMTNTREMIENREEIEEKKDHKLQEVDKGGIEEQLMKTEVEIIGEAAEAEETEVGKKMEELPCKELVQEEEEEEDLHLTSLLGNGNTVTKRDQSLTMMS